MEEQILSILEEITGTDEVRKKIVILIHLMKVCLIL